MSCPFAKWLPRHHCRRRTASATPQTIPALVAEVRQGLEVRTELEATTEVLGTQETMPRLNENLRARYPSRDRSLPFAVSNLVMLVKGRQRVGDTSAQQVFFGDVEAGRESRTTTGPHRKQNLGSDRPGQGHRDRHPPAVAIFWHFAGSTRT